METNNHITKTFNNKIYQAYYERKQIAIILEETNNSKIIVIPSVTKTGNSTEWLKIGGNSAYFYKYFIAPRLNKKPPTIHPDADLNYRFKSGIIAIHWQDSFIKNMATLNLKPKKESGLIIFELNHVFTANEIKKLKNREKQQKAKTNQILKPTQSIPELYHLLLILAQILPNKIRKMDEYYRNFYGVNLTHILIRLFELYIQTVNGNLKISTAKQDFSQSIDKMNAIFIILNENQTLDYSTTQRLGMLLSNIRNSINKNLEVIDNENNSN